MTPVEHRLTILAEQIAAGDAEAQLNRLRLHFKLNRPELGLADLRGAYALFRAQLPGDDAALRILDSISELKLSQQQPLVALQLLTEFFVTSSSQPALGKVALTRRSELVATAVSVVRQQKTPGAVATLLAAAPLLTEDYLLTAATFAVDASAAKQDVASLIEAL